CLPLSRHTLFPYTTLFRSLFTSFDKRPLQYIKATYPDADMLFITSSPLTKEVVEETLALGVSRVGCNLGGTSRKMVQEAKAAGRSEEHTSELQSRENLVCR